MYVLIHLKNFWILVSPRQACLKGVRIKTSSAFPKRQYVLFLYMIFVRNLYYMGMEKRVFQ